MSKALLSQGYIWNMWLVQQKMKAGTTGTTGVNTHVKFSVRLSLK